MLKNHDIEPLCGFTAMSSLSQKMVIQNQQIICPVVYLAASTSLANLPAASLADMSEL